MPLLWSEHAAHIVTLFRPWQPTDGYAEETVAAVEEQLGVLLPAILRGFYRNWGARVDLAHSSARLLSPEDLRLQSDALVFCEENQAVIYWGIPLDHMEELDPPVHYAPVLDWDVVKDLPVLEPWHPSHERVSDFLDALTYFHAFGTRGAVAGGRSRETTDERREALRAQHWQRVELRSVPWGFYPDAYPLSWPLYVRDRQVIWPSRSAPVLAAAGTHDDLEEMRRLLDVTWETQW